MPDAPSSPATRRRLPDLPPRLRKRLPSTPDGWWTVLGGLLVLGFVAVTIGPALLGRGVLLDVGILTRFMPWRAEGLDTDAIWCRGDTVDGVLPQLSGIRSGLRDGDLATWSPYTIGGAPLGALPNVGFLNPVSWPYLVLPLWLAPAFVKLGQFVVGIGGMVLFLRRLGVRTGSALVAGVLFVSAGFMVMWTNWPQVVTACFIPLVFWALDRVAVERRPRDVAVVGITVACMLLAGFPAVTLYTLTLGAVYVLCRSIQVSRSRDTAWVRPAAAGVVGAGLGVLLAVGLAAVQLVPFVRNLGAIGLSERPGGGAGPLGQFLTVLAPGIHGTCAGGDYAGVRNPVEGIAFVGAGALVLAVVAIVLRARRGGPGVPVVLGVLCAVVAALVWYGGTPLELLQKLPLFSSNSIGRASSVFGFLAAALAGIGLDRLLWRTRTAEPAPEASTASWRRHRALGVVLVVSVVIVVVLAFRDARAQAVTDGRLGEFQDALGWPAVVLGVSLAAVAAALLLPRRWRVVGPVVLAVAVIAQSTLFVRALLPTSDRADFYPVTAAHRYLMDHLGHDRYVGGSSWSYPPTSEYYRLNTPFGHGFHAEAWMDLLTAISPDAELTRTYSAFPASVETHQVGDQPILDQLGVRYFAAPPSEVVGRIPEPVRATGHIAPVDADASDCTVSGGALRGIELRVARTYRVPAHRTPRLQVEVTTPGGEVLRGSRALDNPLARGYSLRVAIEGEDLPDAGPHRVAVRLTGSARPLLANAGPDGDLACAAVQPADDGMRLAYADPGAVIYERETALPRIRWAGTSEVVPDAERRVEMLRDGVPADTVLLDSDETPAASGSEAEVEVVSDEPEEIAVDVDADGSGYLVVADSIDRLGWTATVDGRPVDIVSGNHAFAAVPVGPGEHRVVLSYTAPGLRTGVYVSAASVIVTVGLLVYPGRRRRPVAAPSAPVDETVGPPPAP